MLSKLLKARTSFFLLLLFILEFYKFSYLPHFLRVLDNYRLSFIIFILIILSLSNKKVANNSCRKFVNLMMTLLAIAIFFNCLSSYYYRGQSVFITFINWAPILLFYLYYPFSSLYFTARDLEKILYMLFCCALLIHIVQMLFPEMMLFSVDTSKDFFLEKKRLRLFSNSIIILGNLYSFNRLLISSYSPKYFILFCLSLLIIILMGFRIIIVADIIVCLIMFIKIRGLKLAAFSKSIAISVFLVFLFANIPLVQQRIEEITERNETANFENEDYVRMLVLSYYYSDYFKDVPEMIFGSGMVERVFRVNNASKKPYPSEYSKVVSYNSERFHFYPVDWGMLGLSWEAGIPAVIIMNIICLYLVFAKKNKRYTYIGAWGLLLLLIQLTNPYYYYHHNLIYTVLVLVLFEKIKLADSSIQKVVLKDAR